MGNGRLPALVAATVLVLGCSACAGNDVARNAGNEATSARAGDAAAPDPSRPGKARTTGASTKGSRKERGTTSSTSSSTASSKGRGRKSPSRTGPGAADAPLVVAVTDPDSDAEGDAPAFVELTDATVEATNGRLTLTTTVAGAVPAQLTPGEVAIFAYDIGLGESDVTVVAQVDHGGTKAELSRDGEATALEHEVTGRQVRIFIPWRLFGSDRPSFDWTAGTALLEVSSEGMSSRGGDSAEHSTFPSST